MKYAVFQCVIVEADSQEDAAKAACNPLLRESQILTVKLHDIILEPPNGDKDGHAH
jgi:hypothetical protein